MTVVDKVEPEPRAWLGDVQVQSANADIHRFVRVCLVIFWRQERSARPHRGESRLFLWTLAGRRVKHHTDGGTISNKTIVTDRVVEAQGDASDSSLPDETALHHGGRNRHWVAAADE